MELFLNFLWMLIAVFGLSVWRICWAPAHSRRRDPLHEWTAVVAALVFLFFAVSLSDDLQSNLVLFEESANGRRQIIALAGAHSSPQGAKDSPASSVAVLPRPAWFGQSYSVGYIRPLKQTSPSLLESDLRFGRAPPSFSL
jgi:hypothetical protein